MGFEINVDKYSFAAEPEKAAQNYAAELAKKLVEEEKTERSAGDLNLKSQIDAETAQRKTKNNELLLSITELDSKITAETANRVSQDQTLSDSLSSETAQRKKADSDLVFEMTEMASQLEGRINGEIEERVLQDSKLSKRIDGCLTEHQDISGKADKGTTLAEYGITDAISINREVYEDEIDSLFSYGGMQLYKVIGSTNNPAILEYNFTSYYLFVISENNYGMSGGNVWQYRVSNGILQYRNGKFSYWVGEAVSWSEWKEFITSDYTYNKTVIDDKLTVLNGIQEDISTLIQVKADKEELLSVEGSINTCLTLVSEKADKTIILTDTTTTEYAFDFSDMYNREKRLQAASSISIKFADNEYANDYISGLSFNSGETPTSFDYADSGIINWVGTDCATVDGLSIFQPSANTHYDIVFYFNGVQFIGLVNGFVPALGNEVTA